MSTGTGTRTGADVQERGPEGPGVVRPGSVAEAAEVLATTHGPVLVRGAGTKLDWGGAVPVGVGPDRAGLVLDTRGLAGPVEHNPADLTVAVGAGTRLSELQQRLREAGQWLPYDPASEAEGATLGGLLATGEAGPSRLRSGPLRDLVIGSTLVLADGTVAHSGGHVIKNVAGYDLTKLAAGSLGSLFLVADLVLRVQPLPSASVTLAAPADLAGASAAALELARSPLEPAALEWSGDGTGEGRFLLRFDGGAARVEEVLALVRRLPTCAGLDLVRLDPGPAASAWEEHRVRSGGAPQQTTLALQGLPDRLPTAGAAVARTAQRHGADVGLAASLAVGTLVVGLIGGGPGAHAAVLADLRSSDLVPGSSLLLRARAPGLVVAEDAALGPAPSSAALLRRLKDGLDPEGRFAPGRFRPWY